MPEIKIKGYSGNEFEYENVEKVWLTGKESTDENPVRVPFTYGELLSGVEITPDFSTGDQEISVQDGSLVKEATILKPDTLLPENIKQGVEIAGVVGDYVPDTEEVTVELDMEDGDQTIEPSDGKLLSKATVKKPETLVPENILQGVEIGGVVGSAVPEPETEETTVTLDFSGGDMTVEPTEGKFLSKVDIPKPETLVPENIAKDVMIAGVLGTLESGGGGGGSSGGSTTDYYLVRVIDYDGTVLAQSYLNEGDTFTLPDAPSHERLVFEQWVSPIEIVDNAVTVGDCPITIGATYHTASGATEFDVVLTESTGLTFTFQNYFTGKSAVDWGDGTSDNSLTHTYSNYGDYTIKVHGVTSLAGGSSGGVIEKTSYQVSSVFLADTVTTIAYDAFYYCYGLQHIVIPNSVTSIGANAFEYCKSLTSIVVPSSVSSIGSSGFYACQALTYAVMGLGLGEIGIRAFSSCNRLRTACIPNSVTSIGANAFYYCYALEDFHIPRGVTKLENNVLCNNYTISTIVIPNSVTSIGSNAFYYCYGLQHIVIPNSVTSIGANVCYNSCLRHVSLPEGVMSIGRQAFAACPTLKSAIMPSSLTSIANYVLYDNPNLEVVDFTAATTVPTLEGTSAFTLTRTSLKILVPATLYDEWIAATNWSSLSKYIVAV